jgi:Asp-tRNA(Asn)/Glu-tRNA(Gln) amidotransferase C subunit
MNIKEIIQILRTATLNSITKKSLSESCLVQFNGICDAVEALRELDKQNQEPVASTPPQRAWVGLTDEEINDCLVSADPCECLAEPEARQLIEDVEAKLKDKNT